MLWSSLVALAVSVLAVFAALGTSRQTEDAGRAPATAAPPASPSAAPPASATAKATPTPRKTVREAPPLDVDVALARFRSAVEAGQAQGQIRPDVAVDLINLVGPLGGADTREATDRVAELRRKLRDRVEEGSVDAARAAVLRDRLADLGQAVGSG